MTAARGLLLLAQVRLARAFVIVALTAMTAHCATAPASRSGAQVSSSSGVSAEVGDDIRVGELSPRDLGSGECGLFLWRRAGEQSLVFAFNSSTERAAIVIDGAERALRRTEVVSSTSGAQFGEQVFATTGGEISVRLAIHERQDIADGARISRAVLRVADDRGWSAVIGVGGLAACQP